MTKYVSKTSKSANKRINPEIHSMESGFFVSPFISAGQLLDNIFGGLREWLAEVLYSGIV